MNHKKTRKSRIFTATVTLALALLLLLSSSCKRENKGGTGNDGKGTTAVSDSKMTGQEAALLIYENSSIPVMLNTFYSAVDATDYEHENVNGRSVLTSVFHGIELTFSKDAVLEPEKCYVTRIKVTGERYALFGCTVNGSVDELEDIIAAYGFTSGGNGNDSLESERTFICEDVCISVKCSGSSIAYYEIFIMQK